MILVLASVNLVKNYIQFHVMPKYLKPCPNHRYLVSLAYILVPCSVVTYVVAYFVTAFKGVLIMARASVNHVKNYSQVAEDRVW